MLTTSRLMRRPSPTSPPHCATRNATTTSEHARVRETARRPSPGRRCRSARPTATASSDAVSSGKALTMTEKIAAREHGEQVPGLFGEVPRGPERTSCRRRAPMRRLASSPLRLTNAHPAADRNSAAAHRTVFRHRRRNRHWKV